MIRGATAALACGLILLAGCGPPASETRQEAAPASGPAAAESTAEAGGIRFRLSGCTLRWEGEKDKGEYRFDFPEPCGFSRTAAGEVRVVSTEKGEVLAVESSRPEAGSRDCDTRVRGVVAAQGQVRLSERSQNVAMCLPAVWDEMMFEVFAARTVAPE